MSDKYATIQLLISIHKEQTTILYTLWGIYQTLAIGLIGFSVSQEYIRKTPTALFLMSLGIYLFSLGNKSAILRSQDLIASATRQLNDLAPSVPELSSTLLNFQAPVTSELAFAHLELTIFLTIGPWIPYLIIKISEIKQNQVS